MNAMLAERPRTQTRRKLVRDAGAIVIGGDYRGLGVVRSLGRRRIPVWVLHDHHDIATFSRYALRCLPWPDLRAEAQIDYLLEIGRDYELQDWMLIPTTDREAGILSRYRDELSEMYLVSVPAWETMDWAYDKRLTHGFAEAAGVRAPQTHYPSSRAQVATLDCRFPVILKPAVKESADAFTHSKAWRADNERELLEKYDEAARLVDPAIVMVQELIPGGGQTQLSYAALCEDGEPLVEMVARRTRQYPVEFGRFSTLVETVECAEVELLSRRLLRKARYTGLVELEYKFDCREGAYKILDVNPRVWGWHSLGLAAEMDFPYLLWRLVRDEPVPEIPTSAPGLRWTYLVPDLLASASMLRSRLLSPGTYLRSVRGPSQSAIFAKDDPVPYVAGQPSLILQRLRRR